MFKARSVLALCLAVGCLGASAPAMASTAGWMVNHTELTGTAAITETLTTSVAGVYFNAPTMPLFLQCKSLAVGALDFLITAPNSGRIGRFLFSECAVTSPEGCSLANPTIATFPQLLTELTLDGTLGIKGEIKPAEKFGLAQIDVIGTSCAVAGSTFIKGGLGLLLPSGQDERTVQALLVTSSSKLVIGTSPAFAHFTLLANLTSDQTWSFL